MAGLKLNGAKALKGALSNALGVSEKEAKIIASNFKTNAIGMEGMTQKGLDTLTSSFTKGITNNDLSVLSGMEKQGVFKGTSLERKYTQPTLKGGFAEEKSVIGADTSPPPSLPKTEKPVDTSGFGNPREHTLGKDARQEDIDTRQAQAEQNGRREAEETEENMRKLRQDAQDEKERQIREESIRKTDEAAKADAEKAKADAQREQEEFERAQKAKNAKTPQEEYEEKKKAYDEAKQDFDTRNHQGVYTKEASEQTRQARHELNQTDIKRNEVLGKRTKALAERRAAKEGITVTEAAEKNAAEREARKAEREAAKQDEILDSMGGTGGFSDEELAEQTGILKPTKQGKTGGKNPTSGGDSGTGQQSGGSNGTQQQSGPKKPLYKGGSLSIGAQKNVREDINNRITQLKNAKAAKMTDEQLNENFSYLGEGLTSENINSRMATWAKNRRNSGPGMYDYFAGNPKTVGGAAALTIGGGALATVMSNGGRRSNSDLYGA